MMNKVVGGSLFKWQEDFFKLYLSHPKNSIITVKSARQRGKTHTLINLLLYECINKDNFTAIVIVPTYQIARKQYKDIMKMIESVPNLVENANSSYLEIEFYNKSIIRYKSAESRDNLRGDTCNLLIFDEAAFIRLETALECFNFVNTTNGNIVITSTPKFKTDTCLFYKYWSAVDRKEKNCYRIDFCRYDTSALLSEERMEMYRKSLPTNIYRNEVLGEFLELSNALWDITPVLKNNVVKTDNMVAGLDFSTGNNQDETAIAIFNNQKEMYQLYHFSDKTPTDTVDFVVNILKQLPIKKLIVETNSIGNIYLDLLKKKISQNGIRVQIIPFTTTNDSKRRIIENTQLEIQNQTITLLDEYDLKLEFASYEMQTTKTGKITYNGASGIHDDIIMATALALSGFTVGNYNIR